MRISLVRMLLLWFFKTFRKYLPYANFGLFISLVQFFGQKIAKKTSHKWNKWPKLRITNQINTIWIGRSLGAMFMCRESSKNFFTLHHNIRAFDWGNLVNEVQQKFHIQRGSLMDRLCKGVFPVFQTLWKTDSSNKYLFIESKTSNVG